MCGREGVNRNHCASWLLRNAGQPRTAAAVPRSATHASLCVFHSQEEQQLLESRKLGGELASSLTGNFLTAGDINYVLGKVFSTVAQNRMPARTAHTLAYLGQLMLFSLPAVKKEFAFYYKFEQRTNMLNNAVRLSPPPPESEPATAAIDAAQPQLQTPASTTETTDISTKSRSSMPLKSFRMGSSPICARNQ
jgi:hypothetical protein